MYVFERVQRIWTSVGAFFREKRTSVGDVFVVRRIFLIPSPTGWGFLLTTLVILCFSINFTSAAGYDLGILVACLLVAAMPLGARNLVNLRIDSVEIPPVHAGAVTILSFKVRNMARRRRCDIEFSFVAGGPHEVVVVDVPSTGSVLVSFPLDGKFRGLHSVPRIRIRTTFPLGLVTVSTYWQPMTKGLVYCSLEEGVPSFEGSVAGLADTNYDAYGHEQTEFSGVRQYRAGDRLRHLAWRQIARFGGVAGGNFFSKSFESVGGRSRNITEASLDASLTFEEKLSRVTSWLVESEQSGCIYGMSFCGLEIDLSSGPEHLALCLGSVACLPRMMDHE